MKCKNCNAKKSLSDYRCPVCGSVTKFPILCLPIIYLVVGLLLMAFGQFGVALVFLLVSIAFDIPYMKYWKAKKTENAPRTAANVVTRPASIPDPSPAPDPDVDLSALKEEIVRSLVSQNVNFLGNYLEKDLDASDDDLKIIEHFTNVIRENFGSADDLVTKRRSREYISIFRNDRDILRFKYTERAKWLSFAIEDHYVLPDDPRFEAQKDKNQRFWKASISSLSDLSDFDDVFCDAYSFELRKGGD